MTTEIAISEPTSALAIAAEQREFNDAQVAALLQLAGVKDAPPEQLALFFHRCRATGLDPFARQIYLIGRKTKTSGYNGEPPKYETAWTIQTGIHGIRLNGRRAARKAGNHVKTEGPLWKGPDGGEWAEEWLGGRGKPPAVAKFVVFVDGEPHVGIAHYDEFVQTKYNGDPNSMWAKMPANQLAKCAEAQAWNRAYPDDFSGLLLEDSVQTIEPDGSPSPTRVLSERVAPTAAEIIAAPASDPATKQDIPQVEAPAKASPDGGSKRARGKKATASSVTQAQIDTIGAHMAALQVAESEQFDLASRILRRPIASATELTETDGDELIAGLLEARAADDEARATAEAVQAEGAAQ
ncbi:recombinase RecT [Nocardia acidivorans]|uniref:recombinase RecT n=1 Tax=Nocardia acidivorans TaxID=404580 RepID=UPI0008332077|nr:recombinase RecT [Nocardia acidivorans]